VTERARPGPDALGMRGIGLDRVTARVDWFLLPALLGAAGL
jgi:hypothetical protein